MPDAIDRRVMLKMGGAAAGLVLGARAADAQTLPPPSDVDRGRVENGKVVFPEWRGEADPKSAPPPAPMPPEQRVGFAIVALGRLSLEEILPAFAECRKAKVTALVSGSPEKLRTVAAQYGIAPEHCYDYAGFDRLRDDPSFKAVYIVLPNGMHREYTERAARAGKHVLCEKPMATSSKDARAMVAACDKAGVKLMIAYRIQYEPYNQRARRFVQEGNFGRLVAASMTNTQTVAPDGAKQWRHKRVQSGGGSLPDIGLYCINTARFLTAQEPVEVVAHQYSPPGDPRYAEVEETVAFTLCFPGETYVQCLTSYGARDNKAQTLNFARATLEMPKAYQYRGQQMYIAQNQGELDERQQVNIPPKNQFAEEIDHMADCILADRKPRTPGEEGVQDHVVMEAIYESARTGKPVKLAAVSGKDAFRGPMPPADA